MGAGQRGAALLTEACVAGGAPRGAHEDGVRHEQRPIVDGPHRVHGVHHLPLELGQDNGGATLRERGGCRRDRSPDCYLPQCSKARD